MKTIRKHSHAITALGLFIGWYADGKPVGQGLTPAPTRKALQNALKASPVERGRVGRKLAEKVSPEELAEDRTERIAVRPRGPWGSGQGVMILDTCTIAESGTVTLTGRDTRGHSFTRTYPAGIHRHGFRVFAVERL